MSKCPLVLLGAGGHACSVLDSMDPVLVQNIRAYSALKPCEDRIPFNALDYLASDQALLQYVSKGYQLINAIGSLPKQINQRKNCFESLSKQGLEFIATISPIAIVSKRAKVKPGVNILNRAVVNCYALIGENSIINTAAVIEHDCSIGPHNHIAPGAVLSGQVITGSNVHIGTGAVITQGVTVGDNVVIGAGATVTHNIASDSIVYPAKGIVKSVN